MSFLTAAHKHIILKIKFWSNLLFILPLIFAVFYKVSYYIPVIAIVFIISSIYHYSDEKRLVKIDLAFAYFLIFCNCVLLYIGGILSPFAFSAVVFAMLAGYFYFRQAKHGYDFNHGLFHIFSAMISIFSILAFALQ